MYVILKINSRIIYTKNVSHNFLLSLTKYLKQFKVSNATKCSMAEFLSSHRSIHNSLMKLKGCLGRDCMVVEFTTTYAISACHH